MNVAIIGCGYVGQAVARLWQQQQLTVTATTTTPERVPELEAIAERVIVVAGEDEVGLRALLENQHVVLLSVGAKGPDAYEAAYLRTAQTLARVLPQVPTVQQLIYTGSYAVYGDQEGAWVDEASPLKPANRNGEILAETEATLLRAATETLKICVFRLGGIYGPGRELVRIFRRAAGTTRPGSGAEPSNWIHLEDIVGAVEFARQQQLQGIFNLVNSAPMPTRELIERVCTQHNLPPVIWDPSQPSAKPYNAKVSNQKLRDLGYQLVHPEIVF